MKNFEKYLISEGYAKSTANEYSKMIELNKQGRIRTTSKYNLHSAQKAYGRFLSVTEKKFFEPIIKNKEGFTKKEKGLKRRYENNPHKRQVHPEKLIIIKGDYDILGPCIGCKELCTPQTCNTLFSWATHK